MVVEETMQLLFARSIQGEPNLMNVILAMKVEIVILKLIILQIFCFFLGWDATNGYEFPMIL